jgi:hypothetical protein
MTGDHTPAQANSRRDLCVVFEVEPPPESGCPLGRLDGKVNEIRHQLAGGECHTDTALQTDECACPSEQECTEVVHSASDVETTCPCTVFGKFNCVGEIRRESHRLTANEQSIPPAR